MREVPPFLKSGHNITILPNPHHFSKRIIQFFQQLFGSKKYSTKNKPWKDMGSIKPVENTFRLCEKMAAVSDIDMGREQHTPFFHNSWDTKISICLLTYLQYHCA